MASKMMIFAVPDDPKIVEAMGLIAVRHAQLDYVLRMMVKSLGGVTIKQALDATFRTGSGQLRDRVKRLAKRRLGEGNALIRLDATLRECERVTSTRNDIMHNIAAQEVDGAGGVMVRDDNHQWKPLPSLQELQETANELTRLAGELNDARLNGYLKDAMDKHPAE